MWQDTILTMGGILFAASLIPQAYDVWHGKQMNAYTAILTGIVLLSYVITYWSLSLIYAAETTLIVAIMWIYIAVGSWYNGRKSA